MKAKLLVLLCLTLGSLSSTAFAQGSGVGNGGGGGEPTFIKIRDLLVLWIEMGALNIDVSRSSKPLNWAEIVDAMKTVKVQFDPTEPLVVGKSKERACKNYPSNDPALRRIECNLAIWNSIAANEQIAVVFHEYLGILGYETNSGDFSNYPLSSQMIGTPNGDVSKLNTKAMIDAKMLELDVGRVHQAPAAILDFVRSLMTSKGELTVKPDGSMNLFSAQTFYRGTLIKGAYLKNGNYLLNMDVYKSLQGVIGSETLNMKQRGCDGFSAVLIYSEGAIRSIETHTSCQEGDFMSGFKKTETVINTDGSVSVINKLANMKDYDRPILIIINGTKVQNLYLRKF